ncbi:MAG TPA: ATP-dependent DNA helicase, partial [Actinomycetota bacterium]|nr:ATP-dependent DNA helicase [Actinomycetota bacterium]
LLGSDTEEAQLIADEIAALAGDGPGRVPYHEIAILCRKRRLFAKIERALREADIPVEVVGLGGLLMTPEVIDLLAYLQVVVNPGDNVSFARIAMGPRWRVDYHDMAALARWAARYTGLFAQELKELAEGEEVDPGEERFSLSEALGSIDEVEGLSDEARQRLRRLGDELERLRRDLRGTSLVEAIERVLAHTGLEDELAASDSNVARAARANLGSFLDFAGAFSPFEGDASIATFLEFLSAAREGGEDLEVAQPQHENSVKLMTVHQAKGLEFDVVFVPGMAKDIFPDVKVTGNPAKAVHELPYSVREDARWLPKFGVGTPMNAFQAALKQRVAEDERRLAYVALTRARRRLHVTCAHWYGLDYERQYPNGPGDYFVQLAGRPPSAEDGASPPLPAVVVGRVDDCPDENPLREELARRAARWPADDDVAGDPLFPRGLRAAVEEAKADPRAADALAGAVDPAEFERERAAVAEQLELVTAPVTPPPPDEGLTSLSVSSIVQLARCPKQFYWTVVRPLPRRPSKHARLGQEVHRWIELRSIGQGRLDDPEVPVDLAPEEVVGDAGDGASPPRVPAADELKRTFEASRFAALKPRYVEQPFAMTVGDTFLVRGRIDAVYVGEDGVWELVDYKTGREPDEDDPTARLQLAIYALAAQRMWNVEPDRLRVTYFYLGSGRADATPATDLETTEEDLLALFERAQGRTFVPRPSGLCFGCDFRRFCPEGRAYVEAQRDSGVR